MHPVIVLQLLALLVLANGTPVVAKKILGNRLSYPLDGNVGFLVAARPLAPKGQRDIVVHKRSPTPTR